LSGTVLVLTAVGWLLRLVPVLDLELEDMEEHQRASTTMLPDWDGLVAGIQDQVGIGLLEASAGKPREASIPPLVDRAAARGREAVPARWMALPSDP